MKRKLVAILACRNGGSRLYAKPLQKLGTTKRKTILEVLINKLKKIKIIDQIGLAISDKEENLIYRKIAKKNKLSYVFGDDQNVLGRLIACANHLNATDILRVTSESPFPYFNKINRIWKSHVSNNYDASFLDEIIDGCGFEIIKKKALEISHKYGKKKHRSELCTLYMRENNDKFNIKRYFPNKIFFRKDIRLTVDNPEDLTLCNIIYNRFYKRNNLDLKKTINFLDKNTHLKKIIKPYCDEGYNQMYKWKKKI